MKFKSKNEIEPIDISKQISSRTASVTFTQPANTYDQDFYAQTPVTIDSITTDEHIDENFNSLCSFDNVQKNGKNYTFEILNYLIQYIYSSVAFNASSWSAKLY